MLLQLNTSFQDHIFSRKQNYLWKSGRPFSDRSINIDSNNNNNNNNNNKEPMKNKNSYDVNVHGGDNDEEATDVESYVARRIDQMSMVSWY